ncbi:uncharacterized protein LOC141641244 [Silene latifolia]|uniref:uncharacterized protein LOC141641244 n=1 Tax=Silene latifolia TaxID=37657 RepID=UPI003D77E650
MNYEDPNFFKSLQKALKNFQESNPKWQPRRERVIDEFKVSELPEFTGGTDPEVYLDWERQIDRIFEFNNLDDEQCCKYAILRLRCGASLWYESFKARRVRAGKEKITSWHVLKLKLRKRYVPATHRLTTYRKIDDLTQGRLSVLEYISEFENLALMGDLVEDEDLKMARFLRGLNRSIANAVELQNYTDFDTLCSMCLKVEAQGKAKVTPTYGESSRNWRNESDPRASTAGVVIEPKTTTTPSSFTKPPALRENSYTKIQCFKCQAFGYFQNACPNQRTIMLREVVDCRDELFEEEERTKDVFNLEG